MVNLASSIEFVDRIGIVLVHSIWQIAAIAFVVSICMRCLCQTVQQRYWVACIGLITMLCVPTGTLVFSSSAGDVFTSASRQQIDNSPEGSKSPALLAEASGLSHALRSNDSSLQESDSKASKFLPFGTAIVRAASCMWQVGATLMLCLSGLRLRRAHSIVKNASDDVPDWFTAVCQRIATRLKIARQVTVVHSFDVAVPTLIGWLKPVILIPTSMLCEISVQHLELIVAHELAHVRRSDFIVNVLQSLIESLLFFHPCVWWLSNCIRQEREFCADDVVLADCKHRANYVNALLQIESHSTQLRPALAADGGSLVARVKRIANTEIGDGTPHIASSALTGSTSHWTSAIIISFAILVGFMAVQRERGRFLGANARVGTREIPLDRESSYQQIFRAVRNGQTEQVVDLIDENEALLNITDANNSTPLTEALACQHLELAKLLVERGANAFAMNHSDRWGMRSIVEYRGMAEQDRKKFVNAAIAAGTTERKIFHAVWRNDFGSASAILKDDLSQASAFNSDEYGSKGFYNSLPHCGLTALRLFMAGALRL